MLKIVLAILLCIWLLLIYGRKRSALADSFLFMILHFVLMIGINRSLPDIGAEPSLNYLFMWIYVFIMMWLFDVICLNFINAVVYAVIVSIGFYHLQLHTLDWAAFILGTSIE